MATTGTTDFVPDFTDIAEEAWERAGKELRTGYQLRTARRSMNLLLIEWQNRGINMWSIEEGTIPLVSGTATYTLPADTVDLLEHVVRTSSGGQTNDQPMTRMSVSDYSSISNKEVTGRPLQLWLNRLRDAPTATIWPVPDNDGYSMVYWRMRRLEDAGSGTETPDMPFRFYPCLVAGLAYHLSLKDPSLVSRVQMLKADYEEQFRMAASEDREKATLRIVPRRSRL